LDSTGEQKTIRKWNILLTLPKEQDARPGQQHSKSKMSEESIDDLARELAQIAVSLAAVAQKLSTAVLRSNQQASDVD
jgi:hypothetical protein